MSMFHHSRRFLLNTSPPVALSGGEAPAPYSDAGAGVDNAFDANIVMVLSVLLCALICSLGLNSIVRCALRCSNLVASTSPESPPHRHGTAAAAAATGIKKKALKTFPTVTYASAEHLNLPGLDAECAICLSEFVAGDKLRLLPKCSHGFHVRCIDKWLNSHSSCPKCRHNLLETCHKIVGEPTGRSPANFPTPAPVTVVDIAPLEHEGPIHSYRGDV